MSETLTEPLIEPPPTKTDGNTADHLNEHTLASSGASSKAAPPPSNPQAPEDQWNTRLATVLDPVSFMTTGTQDSGGSFAATANKGRDAEKGFYVQAGAELDALIAEMLAAGTWGKTAVFLQAYKALYEALKSGGRSKADLDPALLARDNAEVLLLTIPEGELGASVQAKARTVLGEIDLFLQSWLDLKLTAGTSTSVDNRMWLAFLQTVERQRSILKRYSLLEERGGNGQGTATTAVKSAEGKYVKSTDTEGGRQAIEDGGGTMGLALHSYSLKAERMEAYKIQIAQIQSQCLNGDFETMEEAVAAFKAKVGGGEASAAFNDELEKLARGTWSVADAMNRADGEADLLAQSKDSADGAAVHDMVGQVGLWFSKMADGQNEHYAGERNKIEADKAYEASLALKTFAEGMLASASGKIDKSEDLQNDAAAEHAQATAALEGARLYAGMVDGDRFPVLLNGVKVVQNRADQVEDKLRENEQSAALLDAYQDKLKDRIGSSKEEAASFVPEQREVLAPSLKGKLEFFQKASLTVSGRFPPPGSFMKLFGSVDVGATYITDQSGKMSTRVDTGLTFGWGIDLWLFEITVAVKGVGKYTVHGKHMDPVEAWQKGQIEASNYENAKKIGAKNYGPKLKSVFDTARASAIADCYEPLQKLASGANTAEGRSAFDAQVQTSAEKIREIQGADFKSGMRFEVFSLFDKITSLWDALIQSAQLADGDDLYDDVLALKNLSDEELSAGVSESQEKFLSPHDKTSTKIQGAFDKVNFAKNDPNVEFETAVGVEVGAKANVGKSFSLGVKYAHYEAQSDGKGESFDYQTFGKDVWSLEADLGGWTSKLQHTETDKAGTKDDKGTTKLSFAIETSVPDREEAKEKLEEGIQEKGNNLVDIIRGKSGKSVLESAKDYWWDQDWDAFLEIIDPTEKGFEDLYDGLGEKNELLLSLSVDWKQGKIVKADVAVGWQMVISKKISMGLFTAEAKYSQGMKVTATAADLNLDPKKMVSGVVESGKALGTGVGAFGKDQLQKIPPVLGLPKR